MKLIARIKSYFKQRGFDTWRDCDFGQFEFRFRSIDDEVLLDLAIFLRERLVESENADSKRCRLSANKAIVGSLDEVITEIRSVLESDFSQTQAESLEHNWDFEYFVAENPLCNGTLCIANGIRKDSQKCRYTLASVRRHQSDFYCWTHL